MIPIALSIVGGFATYLVTKIASSGQGGSILRETAETPSMPPAESLPIAPVAPPPKVVAKAPAQAAPPPVAPPPPPDPSPTLPTPKVVAPPPPVAVAPPVAIATPKPVPVPVAPPVVKAPVEAAPPPPAPVPPPDTSAQLPTPRLVPNGPEIEVPVGDKYAEASAPRVSAPAPSPVPAPTPAPAPVVAHPPAGFDGTLASVLAPGVAKNIATKQYDFDRAGLKAFQVAAGVADDGVYGNDSWGALLYFTSDAPKALYKPSMPTPYPWGAFVAQGASAAPVAPAAAAPALPPPEAPAPPPDVVVGPVPPAGFNPATARKLAKQVTANIQNKGSSYGRQLLTDFQRAAGLDADGIYGGASRRALIFYGIKSPPSALFKPTATPATYPWESQANAWPS